MLLRTRRHCKAPALAAVARTSMACALFLALTSTDLDGSFDRLHIEPDDLRFVARPHASPYHPVFADFTICPIPAPNGNAPTGPEPSGVILCFAGVAGLGANTRALPSIGPAEPPSVQEHS